MERSSQEKVRPVKNLSFRVWFRERGVEHGEDRGEEPSDHPGRMLHRFQRSHVLFLYAVDRDPRRIDLFRRGKALIPSLEGGIRDLLRVFDRNHRFLLEGEELLGCFRDAFDPGDLSEVLLEGSFVE